MSEHIKKQIEKLAEKYKAEMIEIRRTIHSNPEIALEEYKTSDYIYEKLGGLGLEIERGVNETGIVALLRGKTEGKTILVRADMDALKLKENNDVPYRSKVEGKMHACGHDAHIAWVLGAAKILSEMRDELHGNVKFVFQPSEEMRVGGMDKMIDEGILQNPKVDVAIAAHVNPAIQIGEIGVSESAVLSCPGRFSIKVIGQGGHASEPWECKDPIIVLHEIYSAIQHLLRKTISPENPAVISITKISAGEVINIIPNEATMGGMVRIFDRSLNEKIGVEIGKVVKNITEMNDVDYEYDFKILLDPIINNKELAREFKKSARKIVGEYAVIHPPLLMASDDFSFVSREIPSVYFFVGVRNEKLGFVNSLHTNNFNIDEDSISISAAVISQFVIDYLQSK